MAIVDVRVAIGTDDVHALHYSASGDLATVQTGYAYTAAGRLGNGNYYSAGMRFVNVKVPPKSTIQEAYLIFIALQNQIGTPLQTQIRAQASGNPPTFYTSIPDFRDRPRTIAYTDWFNEVGWGLNEMYQSPNFAPVIQEVVNRSDWISGNAIVVFWERVIGSPVNAWRVANAHETDSGKAALLHLVFSPPPASRTATIQVTNKDGLPSTPIALDCFVELWTPDRSAIVKSGQKAFSLDRVGRLPDVGIPVEMPITPGTYPVIVRIKKQGTQIVVKEVAPMVIQ